ncbi:MAG: YqaJ viral recombinase family protein [Polyangiales bacterium]
MGVAYKILDDGRDRERWLEARRNTLGASEAATVLGISKFSSPMKLYADKVLGSEHFDNPVMRFGRIFEEQIAHDFAVMLKRDVKLDGRLVHSKVRPWQSCTLDGRQWRGDRVDAGLLEVKTSLFGWEAIHGKDSEGVPPEYYCQLQHQFAVTGLKWGSIVMFNRTSCDLVYQDVEPDPQYIALLTDAEHKFWHQNVLGGVPPAPDAHEETAKAIARIYPQHVEGKTIKFEIDMLAKRDRLALLKKRLKEDDTERRGIENEFKSLLEDAERGNFPDGSGFTYKTNKNGARVFLMKEPK